MSDFDFIPQKALRLNIERAYEFIFELVLLTETSNFKKSPPLVNSLRKTVIIYLASIIEALLLWKLKKVYQSGLIEIEDQWEYKDPHIIHKFNNINEEIVWCRKKAVKKKINKLDFFLIIRLCEKHKLLIEKKLIADINQIRVLRNNLHIGNLANIDQEYKPSDLEFCFSILKRVQKIANKQS
jgi:hypothetical protein